jgi:hypothetical protein
MCHNSHQKYFIKNQFILGRESWLVRKMQSCQENSWGLFNYQAIPTIFLIKHKFVLVPAVLAFVGSCRPRTGMGLGIWPMGKPAEGGPEKFFLLFQKELLLSWTWWCAPVISALGWLKQEDWKLKDSLATQGDTVSKKQNEPGPSGSSL